MQDVKEKAPEFLTDVARYQKTIGAQAKRYAQYPRSVSIETLVKCNAKCGFCPYPTSPRKDTRLPDALFDKIIDELSVIPRSHSFAFTMARINEPLLDPRLESFSLQVAKKIPQAKQTFWSNGTTLKKGKFEWMGDIPDGRLMISLNSIDEDEHTELMGFGTKVVFRNLDYLHQLSVQGNISLQVTLCAPYISTSKASEYQKTCAERWPLFKTTIRPFFQWMGEIPAGREEREGHHPLISAEHLKLGALPCGQWFDLHILANGHATKCCIDESGFADERFNAANRNVLDIYKESLSLRTTLPPRSRVDGCLGCTHLG